METTAYNRGDVAEREVEQRVFANILICEVISYGLHCVHGLFPLMMITFRLLSILQCELITPGCFVVPEC